jgi:uroporphyrinogen-III synthase
MAPGQQSFAVLTRPCGRNESLAHRLKQSGWQVQVAPALKIMTRVLPESGQPPDPANFDVVIFVSAPAVIGYLEQLGGLCDWPAHTLAACVGVASAQAIWQAFGAGVNVIRPDADSSQDSEALWALLMGLADKPRRVLIVRGQDGRDWLAAQCASQGIAVTLHAAYCRALETWSEQTLSTFAQWAQQDCRAVWLLTSPHGIQAVVDQMDVAGLREWGRRCKYLVTHPRLINLVCARLGIEPGMEQIRVTRPDETSILSCFEQFRSDPSPLI